MFAMLVLSTPVALAAQSTEGGRGALRPYVHVLLAYGVAWVIILFWVWWIARNLKRVNNGAHGREHTPRQGPDGP